MINRLININHERKSIFLDKGRENMGWCDKNLQIFEALMEKEVEIIFKMAAKLLYMHAAAAAPAKSLQSCPTLCDPIDGSPPGSPVPGTLQAKTVEWVAISFSNAWKWKVKVKSLSRVQLLATPWTAAYQAPPSMGFSRQEYWSGVPLPSLLYMHMCMLNRNVIFYISIFI